MLNRELELLHTREIIIMMIKKYTVVSIWISILLVYGSLSPRFLPGEKEMIALTPVLALYIGLKKHQASTSFRPLALFFILSMVFSVGLIYQNNLYWSSIVSSLIVIAGFLFFSYSAKNSAAYVSKEMLVFLTSSALLAALLAPFFTDAQDFGRFEPPSFFLYGVSVAGVLFSKKLRDRMLFCILLTTVLLLALQSSWRFVFLIYAALLPVIFVVRVPTIRFIGIGLFIGLVLLGGSNLEVENLLFQFGLGRYVKILTLSGLQLELGIRFLEAKDALAHVSANGNWWTALFGFGHGAHFEAKETLLPFSDTPRDSWQWRFSDHGEAYIIHFGPMRIFLRYGLLGVTIYMYVFFVVFRAFSATLLRRSMTDERSLIYVAWLICAVLYVLRSFLQPVEHEYLFWISISVVLNFGIARRTDGSPL